jgi:hypothetical protein
MELCLNLSILCGKELSIKPQTCRQAGGHKVLTKEQEFLKTNRIIFFRLIFGEVKNKGMK